ncbi:MAG: hypothetical protein HC905_23080 [Bacteroidales bacterium]|nr:hypothetical protein [Bacteroidales bacterium]
MIRKLNSQGFRNATAVSGKIRVSRDIFQNPSFKRHDKFGYMYRLPEVAAAMGLAQLEKLEWFVEKRIKMASMYKQVIKDSGCKWLVPQIVPSGDVNSYYTFAVKMINPDLEWAEVRKNMVRWEVMVFMQLGPYHILKILFLSYI